MNHFSTKRYTLKLVPRDLCLATYRTHVTDRHHAGADAGVHFGSGCQAKRSACANDAVTRMRAVVHRSDAKGNGFGFNVKAEGQQFSDVADYVLATSVTAAHASTDACEV